MDKEEKDNSKNNMHNNKEDDSNNSNNSNKENRNKNAKDNSKSIESLQKNHYQNHRKRVRKRRVIFLGSLLFIFGTKSYLYFNFLIGNDIIIKLDVSQENFNLQHGQEGILNFKSSATTNPFCTASCTAKFEDLSSAEKST